MYSVCREDDARYAWKKAEGMKIDGRTWRVDYANRKDLDFFEWDDDLDYPPRKGNLVSSPGRASPLVSHGVSHDD